MLEISNNSLVPSILALQFVAFGWRINREIPVGDAGRKTWFPIPDVINIVSMLSVVAFCIVEPLKSGHFEGISRIVLAAAFVQIAFHPICMTGHYRLFSKHGRHIYTAREEDYPLPQRSASPASANRHYPDYPYCTAPEAASIVVGLLLATGAAWYVA